MIGQGGHLIARQLKQEGVDTIFTLCGGHIVSIYDGCIDEGIRVIDVRHEQAATHAADAWGRITGTPGVAVVTAGPGVTDAVTGVANAWRASSPMLCIGGQGPFAMFKKGSLQEMDHVALMAPITVSSPWRRAITPAAKARQGAVFLPTGSARRFSAGSDSSISRMGGTRCGPATT